MTGFAEAFVRGCTFKRHPASIDLHNLPGSATPGFEGIATWSPRSLGGESELLETDAAPTTPEAPVPLDKPSGYRPPPFPVLAVQRDAQPRSTPLAWTVEEPTATDLVEPTPLAALDKASAAAPEPVNDIAPSSPPSASDPFAILRSPPPAASVHEAPPLRRAPSLLRRASLPGTMPDAVDGDFWDGAGTGLVRPGVPRPALRRSLATGLALAACLVGLIVAGFRYGPALLGSGQSVTAVFNAPMMVVRSAATGRVVTVAATATQIVDPKSPLLTIHTDDGSADRPVLAGVHGMIRSVETVPGAALVAGAPLVRLQDCDRAFLTVPPGTKLQAGQTVQVKLPDQKPFAGKIRASVGVMEPPDSLVVGLEPGVVTASCPVGRSAAITPIAS